MTAPCHDDLDHELQQHAAALRGIARDLLRDGHAADDVTQATLQQAVARGDLRPGPLGGWLRTVLVNFARQWRRSERRRVAREAALPMPPPLPSLADTLARRETLQAVTDAVLQLDEPYQSTILLRYFEDLPPRAISQRTGTSVATVKSRLQRGLALLRTRLDQRGRDDWRLALTSTFGLTGAAAAGITIATGAWLMGTTTKVLLAAGVLCVGGLIAFGLRPEPRPPIAAAERAAVISAAVAASAEAPPVSLPPQREEVPVDVAVEPWLAHPFAFELELLAVDATGLPVEGHSPTLAPRGVEWNRASMVTGPDGTAVVTWRSRQPRGAVVVRDGSGGLRELAVEHGHPCRLTVLATGTTLATGTYRVTDRLTATASTRAVLDLRYQAPTRESVMQTGLHPFASFLDACTQLPTPESAYLRLVNTISFTPATPLQLAKAEVLNSFFRIDGANVVEHVPDLRGIVLRDDGTPAADVQVALMNGGPQPLQRVTTDGDGAFAFRDLTGGDYRVRAGGGSDGLAILPVTVDANPQQVTLQLQPGATVRGRVPGLQNAIVSWRADDGSWCDECTTGADGGFVLANLPMVTGTISVRMSTLFPVATVAGVRPEGAPLTIAWQESSGALQFDPRLPSGCENAALEARLWQVDNGIGVVLPAPEAGQPWRAEHLQAGWYHLELFAQASGWFDAGTHWVDGITDCDLGRIALPQPGTVRIAAREGTGELSRLRSDVDVRVPSPVPFDAPLMLPAGDYAFACQRPDGTTVFQRFSVRAGEEVTVPVAE